MKQIDNTYAVSTHIPMIEMVLKQYNPLYIMELGVGLNSTPLFFKHKCRKTFVENDIEWIEYVKKRIHVDNIVQHSITDEYNGYNIPQKLTEEVVSFYKKLSEKESPNILYPSLLFVDNFIAIRHIAIRSLYPLFDLIIFHDCDPTFEGLINYTFELRMLRKFNLFILKNDSRWTGCFINKEYKSSEKELSAAISPFIEAYCKQHDLVNNWKLEKMI